MKSGPTFSHDEKAKPLPKRAKLPQRKSKREKKPREFETGDMVIIQYGRFKAKHVPVLTTAIPWVVIVDIHGEPYAYDPDDLNRA
jgi:hypothetical protein